MDSTRSELIIGKDNLDKLKELKVAVFGLGGVGSYCLEALCRTGIGKFIIVDGDVVEKSNINRQIIALSSTLGRKKTEVMAERMSDINPDVEVQSYSLYYEDKSADEVDLKGTDYVVDAIDSVKSKVLLAVVCKRLNIPLISCMGTGNKSDPTLFKVKDIYDTSYCPLAKVMRRELKKAGIESLKTVCSEEIPKKSGGVIGSLSFVPPVAGMIMAGEVIKDLIKK